MKKNVAMIDTGSEGGIVLSRSDAEQVELTEKVPAPPASDRVGGRDVSRARAARSLRIGSVEVAQPTLWIGRSSHLGSAFLRDYVLTLDLRPQWQTAQIRSAAQAADANTR